MKKLLLAMFLTSLLFAQMEFSEPKPTFDNPRKVVLQINDSDIKKVNQNLGAIYNILKEYPTETLKVVVVTYSNGVRMLKKDYDKKTLTRVTSLMEYDVEFIVCRNTMESMHWKDEDFIDDVSFVQAGIAELIERQVAGYVGVMAY